MKKKAYLARPPTAESLTRAAERYMGRFAASEASLRRVLQTNIRRVAMANAVFASDQNLQDQLTLAIEAIIRRYVASGILDDVAYADMKRSSLRRAGRSRTAIVQRLYAKGVPSPVISQTMEQEHIEQERDETTLDETAAPEYKAALIFAKRKKLGRFATRPPDALQRNKHIAAMARAGFGFQMIKKILDSRPDDGLRSDD